VINLRAALVGVTNTNIWSSMSSLPCPVSFSAEERKDKMDESSQWNESEALLSKIRSELGIDLEGGRARQIRVGISEEFGIEARNGTAVRSS
jgi:hypothetical protein